MGVIGNIGQAGAVARSADPLPADWKIVPLEEIAEINPRLDKTAIPDDLPVSFVPMPAVGASDGVIDVSNTKPFKAVKKGFTPFQEGDVLFAKITPCMENGKMAVVPKLTNGYGFGSTEFHVLRPKPGIDARYLYYYVSNKNFRAEAERHMSGAVGQKRVPTAYIKESKIPVAPLDQQQRIVAEIEKQFSLLDEAVANLKRVKSNLKRYKAAVLKAAVEGKLTEEWRKQHPDVEPVCELLEQLVDDSPRRKKSGVGTGGKMAFDQLDDLPAIPDSWAWSHLGRLAEIKGGITVDRKRVIAGGVQVPYLRVANVQRGRLDLGEIKVIVASRRDIAELKLERGDILFNEGGDRDKLGRGWIWEEQIPRCIHQNHVFRARLRIREMSPKLVSWWGNSFGKRYFLREGKQTTNLASINLAKLSHLPVPVPPLAEQEQIVAETERRLSIAEECEIQAGADLGRAESLRLAILAQAFRLDRRSASDPLSSGDDDLIKAISPR